MSVFERERLKCPIRIVALSKTAWMDKMFVRERSWQPCLKKLNKTPDWFSKGLLYISCLPGTESLKMKKTSCQSCCFTYLRISRDTIHNMGWISPPSGEPCTLHSYTVGPWLCLSSKGLENLLGGSEAWTPGGDSPPHGVRRFRKDDWVNGSHVI